MSREDEGKEPVVPAEKGPRAPAAQHRTHVSYWLTRFMILRLLGVVYAVAFLVAANQMLPLIGSHGLLPVGSYLERLRQLEASTLAGFWHLPSL